MGISSIDIAGISLSNPLIASAGTAGLGPELADVLDLRHVGAVTTKSITPESREGNDPWRVVDLPGGMLNAIGLANPGLDSFVKTTLPMLSSLPTVVIGSVAGHSVADYVAVAQEFDGHDALPLVELNVSCPNTDTGRQFGDDPELLTDLVTKTRAVLKTTPMIVKLSPGSMNILDLAEAAVHAGADALCLGNTMPAMAVDPETGSSRIGRASGGLSGPAIHPMVSKIIHDVSLALNQKDLHVPLIATGGVTHWEDAAEFIILGAHAVGMGTILMADPIAPRRILKGLESWVRRKGGDINSLRGSYTA